MIKNILLFLFCVSGLFQSYAVSVISYGADPSGAQDSTTAIQAAVNAADEVYFPAGTYLCNTVYLDNGSFLHGDGAKSIIKYNTAIPLVANAPTPDTFIENITIRELQLLGKVETEGFSEFKHLIRLAGVQNLRIENCLLKGFQGDGICLAGQNTSSAERHNKNVRIVNCTFDGINNDNRQGISVTDAEDLMIDKCSFYNCTRSNMPGCIDIEPNAVSFAIIKNISVSNCTFENCQGGVGNICLCICTAFTTPPTGFVFANNLFKSNVGVAIVSSAGAETHSHNIVISGNVGYGVSRPFSILPNSTSILRGIIISNNTFYHSSTALLGFEATANIENVSVTGNVFRANGPTGGLVVRSGSNIVVSNNIFDGHSDYGMLFGMNGSTVSKVSVIGNMFTNMVNEAVEMAATNANPATNIFYNNQLNGAPHNFKAFRTDNNSVLWNGNTAVTFNTATLPDSFPMGISTATLNGDTGVPAGIGSTQGILTTYRLSTIANHTYQTFHHSSNTLKLGNSWMRRRNQTTNDWTRWYEIVGN